MWKGDKVGYAGVHYWIKTHYPKPSLCEDCKSRPAIHAACITGNYTRDIKNWKYLCQSCHFRRDGVFDKLHAPIDMSDFRCVVCGSSKTRIRKENGRPLWNRLNNKPLCTKCARHIRYVTLKK